MGTQQRPDRWEVHDDGERTWVERNGHWFADADDVDDAIGVLQGQRVTRATFYIEGYEGARDL